MKHSALIATLGTLLILGQPANASQSLPTANVLQTAQALLDQQRTEDAYALLLSMELEHSQSPAYNYMLGVASLQSGHYSQARSAFERTILLEPENAGAYLDLAITEIELNNYHSARQLLLKIEESFTPPPAIRQIIALYKNRIQQALQPRTRFTGELEVGYGYMANVNNGTNHSLIQLDLGNGPVDLIVSDSSQSQPDHYQELGSNMQWGLQVGRWRHQLTSAIQWRDYTTLNEYDTVNILAGASSKVVRGAHQLEAGLYSSMVWLDGADYQSGVNATLRYDHTFRSGLRLGSQLRANQARYQQTPTNNLDRLELGFLASYPFNSYGSNLIQAQLQLSQGEAQNARPGGNTETIRFSLQWVNQPSLKSLVRVGGFWANDEDSSPYNPQLFGQQIRETERYGLNLSYSYYMTPAIFLTVTGSLSENRSTLDLFTTENHLVSIRLGYKF